MNSNSKGWICLHRKITEWEWYDDANVLRLFLHCLLKANYEDKKWKGIVIKQGSFVTSYPKLVQELKLTSQQIRTAIFKLKSTGEITHSTTARYSIITIKNYDLYQDNNRLNNRIITDKQQTNNRLITPTNNINNINKENNILFIGEKKSKKTDPPLNSFFKSEYKKIFKNTPNLSFAERDKLVELGADVENFRDTIPIVLNKLKNIQFNFKNGSNWNANHHWLLKNDNYLNVLDGTYDDKNSTEYEQALARCEARAKEQEQNEWSD